MILSMVVDPTMPMPFLSRFICAGMVDWLSGCKYGFIPYLQNNLTLHVSTWEQQLKECNPER
jgi:hypothetical protein